MNAPGLGFRPVVSIITPTCRAALPTPRLSNRPDTFSPLALRELIAGKLASSEFRLLDSRTRYWRYYLLIGPAPRWKPQALGQKLLSIVRQNIDRERAIRGVGSRLYNRTRLDAQRAPTVRELRRLVAGFKAQYGAAARNFWKAAKQEAAYPVLERASRALRDGSNYSGFFDREMEVIRNGHARSAFNRLQVQQSETAKEIARVLMRGISVSHALSMIKRSTLRLDSSRRLALVWTLLATLFRTTDAIPQVPTRRREDDEDDEALGDQVALARIASDLLKQYDFGLDAVFRNRLRDLLTSALEGNPFVEPIVVAARDGDGTRQRLFADLRLSSLHRLLEATR